MKPQTTIKSIKIENVRGISSCNFIFDQPEMIGNKFHILVAPNGFGKTSIAQAFDSLRPRSLKVSTTVAHKNDETLVPSIEISYKYDGQDKVARADNSKNEIFKEFSVLVIKSRVKPHATSISGYNKFAKPKASMIIDPITLVEKVPERFKIKYNNEIYKIVFGHNMKILPDMDKILNCPIVLSNFLAKADELKLGRKGFWDSVNSVFHNMKEQKGNKLQMRNWIEQQLVPQLRNIPELARLVDLINHDSKSSEVDNFLLAYQFTKLYIDSLGDLRKHHQRSEYDKKKDRCKEMLKIINSNPEWINVVIKETKGALIVGFPEATQMSNGQRDLLSFVMQLLKAEFELKGQRAIIVVDEVFDYLDECNLLFAQYYFSRFCNGFAVELFPLILTHLDPIVFSHSVLGFGKKDIRKVNFLIRLILKSVGMDLQR